MVLLNLFLLAADDSSRLLQILRDSPSLASSQDESGYSLLHAAASYNHMELLRSLVQEFHVNVDLKDKDGETALFVTETLECARLLIEELHSDFLIKNSEGKTASEKIAEEDEFPQVAIYLRTKEVDNRKGRCKATEGPDNGLTSLPPLPMGLSINFSSMAPEDIGEVTNSDFQRKIEELASRPDFNAEAGQNALRELIEEVLNENTERKIRQRII